MSEGKINYCIGAYWGAAGESIGEYAYGSVIHYGTVEEANRLLEYVKGKSGRPYQVCIVMPLGEYEQKLKDVERNASCDGYDDGYRVGFDSGSKYSD